MLRSRDGPGAEELRRDRDAEEREAGQVSGCPGREEQEARGDEERPFKERCRPEEVAGCVNMNGTRKHGSAYFQVSIIVLYGLPPVIAAAANGDRATGGDTSLSTA